jgi:hypothetical protein
MGLGGEKSRRIGRGENRWGMDGRRMGRRMSIMGDLEGTLMEDKVVEG